MIRKSLILKIICVVTCMIFFHTSLIYSSSASNGNLRVPMKADKRKQKYLAIVLYHKAASYGVVAFNIENIDNLLNYQKVKEMEEQQKALDFHIETIKIELGIILYGSEGIAKIKGRLESVNLAFESAETSIKNMENIVRELNEINPSLNIEGINISIAGYRSILSGMARLSAQIRPIPKWAGGINFQSSIKDIVRNVFNKIRTKLKSL